MIITGELKKDNILIEKTKDIGRLYNKSGFGQPRSGNKLQLNLIEGIFLLDEKKIRIYQNKKLIDFQKLVEMASKKFFDFEIRYLAFKDLRKRGYAIKDYEGKKKITFHIKQKVNKQIFVSVFSERDFLDIKETTDLEKYVSKKEGRLWFAIIDEEGDITYYEVSKTELKGKTKTHAFQKTRGVFLKDRVVIFDEKASKTFFEKEFYGKFFGNGLQLSFVEALYLSENNLIDFYDVNEKEIKKDKIENVAYKLQPDIKLRLAVFRDLKKKGLIVKTGFKFGTHFRVYTKNPDETHAEYLVHIVKKDFKSIWSEISRAVRLAHSVNKEFIFASVNKKIEYIRFGRLRP